MPALTIRDDDCLACGHTLAHHDDHLECFAEGCECVLFDVAPYDPIPERNPDPTRRYVTELRAEIRRLKET